MGVTKVAHPGVEGRPHGLGAVLGWTVAVAHPHVRTMAIAPSGSLAIERGRSLEARWIFAGRLTTAMAGWFGRFPARTITLEDAYLVSPHLPGLSVKVRERGALEVKVHQGSPGLLDVPGRARGRLESWQKWSFPCEQVGEGSGALAGWRTVRKRRRISRFSRANGPAVARFPGLDEKPGCAVELAEFHALGGDWWTMGFEATGPADVLRGQLEAAAALVFGPALPDGVELGVDDSMSYAQWLHSQP
jgi:hypothetical protein